MPVVLPGKYATPGLMWPGLIWPGDPETLLAPSQTLVPVPAAADAAGLDITAALAPPLSLTLRFVNTMQEHLFVQSSAAGVSVQVNIGTTVLGQPVNPFAPVTLTQGHLYKFGRFHTVLDAPVTGIVTVTLSTASSVQVALVQDATT